MARQEITAKAGKEDDAPSATVLFDFGDDLDEAVDKFGNDVVYKRFVAACTIDIQALIRRLLTRVGEDKQPNPATADEIQKAVDEYKPGAARPRKSQKEKAEDLLSKLSDEDKQELLKSLMAGSE